MSVRADITIDSMVKLKNWKNEKGKSMRDLTKYTPGEGFTPNIWLTVAQTIKEHIQRSVR